MAKRTEGNDGLEDNTSVHPLHATLHGFDIDVLLLVCTAPHLSSSSDSLLRLIRRGP